MHGKTRQDSTFRSALTSSNLYSHYKSLHPEEYLVLKPIVKAREKNKHSRDKPKMTIEYSLNISRQRSFGEASLKFFFKSKHPEGYPREFKVPWISDKYQPVYSNSNSQNY